MSGEGRTSVGRLGFATGATDRIGGTAPGWASASSSSSTRGWSWGNGDDIGPSGRELRMTRSRAAGISWRTQDQEIELRTIQQVGQNLRRRCRAEVGHDLLLLRARRDGDLRPGALLHRGENFGETGFVGTDRQQTTLKQNFQRRLRWRRRWGRNLHRLTSDNSYSPELLRRQH